MKTVRDVCSSYDWIDTYSVNGAIRSALSHNNEPTFLQLTSLMSSKAHIDLERHRITQDIDILENALQLLRTRRDSLDRLSVRHAGALSTFRRLPNEILVEIFFHTCGDQPIKVACLREGPWKLRAVCRKWASIVEGCSRLWCNMFVDVAHDDVSAATFAQALKFCRSRPIQMTLCVNQYFCAARLERSRVASDIILSSAQRWETLSITSCDDLFPFVLEFFPHLEQNLPLLRSLKLIMKYARYGNSVSSVATLAALTTAPLLENVHMQLPDLVDFEKMVGILSIPRQQIRELSCSFFGDEHAAPYTPLLFSKERFPVLERYIYLSGDAGAQSSRQAPASHRLEHDGVTHLVTSQADVLSAFSFPALRNLSLVDPGTHPHNVVFNSKISGVIFKRASDMLSASRCSLVSLTLSHTFTLVDELLPLLRSVPTLEILDMRVAWRNGKACDEILCKLFTALGRRRKNAMFSLLPVLQDLRLSIVAASRWLAHDPEDYFPYPYRRHNPHNFRFISKVCTAITERSKDPSDFRVFSFTMSTDDSWRWCFSEGDIDRLMDLKCTNFSLERPARRRS